MRRNARLLSPIACLALFAACQQNPAPSTATSTVTSPSPSTVSSPDEAKVTASTPVPASRPNADKDSSPRPSAVADCESACALLDKCPTQMFVGQRERCRADCSRESNAWASAYASCVTQVGCKGVEQ